MVAVCARAEMVPTSMSADTRERDMKDSRLIYDISPTAPCWLLDPIRRSALPWQVIAERSEDHVVDRFRGTAEARERIADSLPGVTHKVGVLQALLQCSAGSLIEPIPIAPSGLLNVAVVGQAVSRSTRRIATTVG